MSQPESNESSEATAQDISVDVTEGSVSPEPDADKSDIENVETDSSFAGRHPFAVYTALRFGLLVITALVCYLLGARGFLLIVLAFLVSGIISFTVLVPQRDAVGKRTSSYFRRLNDKIESSKTAEDDYVDAQSEAPVDDSAQQPSHRD